MMTLSHFTKKSDYSANNDTAYRYVVGTNKLDSVTLKDNTSVSFGYDAKGNQTHRNGTLEVTYNVFNKPLTIDKNNTQISLAYGADLARYKQVRVVDDNGSPKTITTHYIDKHYEVEIDGDNKKTRKSYISDIAILTEKDTGSARINYTHRDRLGSAVTFTDQDNKVTARRHFDPFGKPRGGDWSSLDDVALGARLGNNLLDTEMATRRGFTDHEHLDEAELIHMNGRVYDYNVGRFMSVDPYIQGNGNSQGINPYSYIMNNPMAGTDPTGYEIEGPVKENKKVKVTGSVIARDPSDLQQVGSSTIVSGGTTVKFAGNSPSTRAETFANISSGISAIAYNGSSGNNSNSSKAGMAIADFQAQDDENLESTGTTSGIKDRDGNLINKDSLIACEGAFCSSSDLGVENNDVFTNQHLNGNPEDRVYAIYVKVNPETGQVYVGRTSGYGTPKLIVRKRDARHKRLNELGFGPAVVESAIQSGSTLRDYATIRGREQQLINRFGGVGHSRVANRIRGVSKNNIAGRVYHQASSNEFGEIAEYDGNF